ncbi:MAG: cytochrome b [Gammaproteobacteria bacterium]
MLFRNTDLEFGLTAKLLHWLLATGMIILIPLGWYMVGLDNETVWYWQVLDFHVAVGLSTFVVAFTNAVWNQVSPKPEPMEDLKNWLYPDFPTVELL